MKIGNYNLLDSIGTGSFGVVYNGTHKITNDSVAIKFSLEKDNWSINNEINCYILLKNNPHIPKLKTIGKINNCRYIVMELLEISLEKLMNKKISFSPQIVCNLGLQLITCLEYIHSKGIVHRDLKPANMLLSKKQNRLCICDFGMAVPYYNSNKKHIEKYNVQVGSIRYMSIDSHQKINPVRKDDLESVAYILWELLEGSLPWESESNVKYIKMISEPINIELQLFIKHCRNLKYHETPNYSLLKAYLKRLSWYNT